MNVCITGATGYIGSNLVARLISRGVRLKVFVRRDTDVLRLEPIIGRNPEISYHAYSNGYDGVFEEGDVIVHLAALQSAKGVKDDEYYHVNCGMVGEMIAACPQKLGLFLLVSTVRVYGNHNDAIVIEDSPYLGKDRYALSKIAAERLIEKAGETSGLPYCILQPTIVYGPDTQKGFATKLIKLAKLGVVPVVDSGKNIMSFIYIDDLIDILEKIIFDHAKIVRKKFIVSYPEDISIAFAFETLGSLLRGRCILLDVPKGLLVAASRCRAVTPSQVEAYTATMKVDPTNAISFLGIRPQICFTEGIRRVVANLKRDKNGL